MKSLIERKKLDEKIASEIQILIDNCDNETKAFIENRIGKLKRDIEELKKQKTKTEKLQIIADLVTFDLRPLYYVENGLLYHRLNPSGQPNRFHIAPRIDGVEERFCAHEVIHFLNEYRK